MTKRTLRKHLRTAEELYKVSGWESAYDYLICLVNRNRMTNEEFHFIVNTLGI